MIDRYQEEDFLLLSGIQHIAFCERQWALIHIEQAWAENVRTIEGKHLHERTDDPFEDETRKDIRVVRAMPLVSHKLGLRGVADVVEFYRVEELEGVTLRLNKRKGLWRPYPVEYKRGRPKPDDRDAVQLCAQAIALEEMLKVSLHVAPRAGAWIETLSLIFLSTKILSHPVRVPGLKHCCLSCFSYSDSGRF